MVVFVRASYTTSLAPPGAACVTTPFAPVNSPASRWEPLAGRPTTPVVRTALAEWERQRGIRLEWLAAEHLTPGHPHCHVDVRAVCLDSRGQPRRLRLSRADLAEIRECTRRVLERARERRWREIQQEREIERARERAERALGQVIEVGLRALARAARAQERLEPLPVRRRGARRERAAPGR